MNKRMLSTACWVKFCKTESIKLVNAESSAHNEIMLYKFKSKATGDLIMLEPQGRQILQIMGKQPGAKGIVLASEMLQAIKALQEAVIREEAELEAAQQATQDQAAQETAHKSSAHHISLRQRVVPFIDMLQRAHAENVDVVWGV
jgi:Domain of unknown function (DUF1840)